MNTPLWADILGYFLLLGLSILSILCLILVGVLAKEMLYYYRHFR